MDAILSFVMALIGSWPQPLPLATHCTMLQDPVERCRCTCWPRYKENCFRRDPDAEMKFQRCLEGCGTSARPVKAVL